METRHDLRCFCSRRAKLAEWGRDAEGRPYVHIRIFKQGRVFGEVVATSGTLAICCRECFRWTHVSISGATGAMEFLKDYPVPAVASA